MNENQTELQTIQGELKKLTESLENTEGWHVWSRHIFSEIKRLSETLEQMPNKENVQQLNERVTRLNTIVTTIQNKPMITEKDLDRITDQVKHFREDLLHCKDQHIPNNSGLDKVSTQLKEITDDVVELQKNFAVLTSELKMKSGLWGAIMGVIPLLLYVLYQYVKSP